MIDLNHFVLVILSLVGTWKFSVDDWLAQLDEVYPDNPPKISIRILPGKGCRAICFTAQSIEDLDLGLALEATREAKFSLSLDGKCFPLSVIISHLKEKDEILTLLSNIRGQLQLSRPADRPEALTMEFNACAALYKELSKDPNSLPDFSVLKTRLVQLSKDLSALQAT